MAFAENTKVPVERTQAQIREMLLKNGATSLLVGESASEAVLAFEMLKWRVKFHLPLPPQEKNSERVKKERRRRWRALHLVIKSKLEAVQTGIRTFEQEFLADIALPDGVSTVYSHIRPLLADTYKTGKMQPLLPPSSSEER